MSLTSSNKHKLLVANRGEIAVRVLRTARRLRISTLAIYTQTDATAPHVALADEAAQVGSYTDFNAVLRVCHERGVTLVHPGYGFLAENPKFAKRAAEAGVKLLGPSAQAIEDMGLKHRARALAVQAGVPVVPGSDPSRLVGGVDEAVAISQKIGYPVMLKATAGGGGIGLVVCKDDAEVMSKFGSTQERAEALFYNRGVFIEKFFPSSRHIEIQIFGNGLGHVIHMGERECSVQRRHQKIVEETPSPYLQRYSELREQMCDAAVRLGKLIKYGSAGTVEFLVDDKSGNFYFLEMNTRLQVEHPITEAIYPDLDLVELMIRQGLAELEGEGGLAPSELDQAPFVAPPMLHAIEARVYCENPIPNVPPGTGFTFRPSPGILQFVRMPEMDWLRVDTWIATGTAISTLYDPLLAKVIVSAPTREEALERLSSVLSSEDEAERIIVQGPPTNIYFLSQIFFEDVLREGNATTEWIDKGGVTYTPCAFTVLSPGLSTAVQALPLRSTGLGIPPSGPFDILAFQAANIIVGNNHDCEALELVVGLKFSVQFHVDAVVAVTGARAMVQIDGRDAQTWARLVVGAGEKLTIGAVKEGDGGGLRSYVAILGGLPDIPEYLGSKSTSMGMGGYQGRALQTGDMITIRPLTLSKLESAPSFSPLPPSLIPRYPTHWSLHALPGPHDDTEFLTTEGIAKFYRTRWKVSSASNRMGIRLEKGIDTGDAAGDAGPPLLWARANGGEGGSHPSNILDNGYARGSINLNGDTPVILTCEGPSMGGYVCVSTVATADQWKFGQLRPGDTVQFVHISHSDAMQLSDHCSRWLEAVLALSSGFSAQLFSLTDFTPSETPAGENPKLHLVQATEERPKVVFRQAGDSAILVEYGEMTLDFAIRARIHALETAIKRLRVDGIREFAPCIRSTMIHYDPYVISQESLLRILVSAESSLPSSLADMTFPGRKITFPIVLDDKWNREALERYMRSARDKAVYLPSNVEYLARNNGLQGKEDALDVLVKSPWLVFGVGFYLACPFLVPIDPRCRLVGQKMNPSRTYTPRGAVGIAGLVAAIYPVESPGGYQLFGRTLSTWQPWGIGKDFRPEKPWVLEPFDQVEFEPVDEETYEQFEKDFDCGRYEFKIQPLTFSMKDYLSLVDSIKDEVTQFRERQAQGVAEEEAREEQLLAEWIKSKNRRSHAGINSEENPNDQEVQTDFYVTAHVSGTVWKLLAHVGERIVSAEQIVCVLEAMKTEVNVCADEEHVGKSIVGIAGGIREGEVVAAGQKLVYFG